MDITGKTLLDLNLNILFLGLYLELLQKQASLLKSTFERILKEQFSKFRPQKTVQSRQ